MLKCVQNRNKVNQMSDRISIRNTFKNYPNDTAIKFMLKDYLFNILSNHTQSMSQMRKEEDEKRKERKEKRKKRKIEKTKTIKKKKMEKRRRTKGKEDEEVEERT